MSDRLSLRLDSFEHALDRLDQALAVPPDAPLALDGTLQRVAFTFELAWKTLQAARADEGLEARTPREALRQAFSAGWLPDEAPWLEMLHDRNRSSHVYDEGTAAEIYARVRPNAAVLRAALNVLQSRS